MAKKAKKFNKVSKQSKRNVKKAKVKLGRPKGSKNKVKKIKRTKKVRAAVAVRYRKAKKSNREKGIDDLKEVIEVVAKDSPVKPADWVKEAEIPTPSPEIERVLNSVPARMLLLNEAAKVTGLDRQPVYGDPLVNFAAVSDLKSAFWGHVTKQVALQLVDGPKIPAQGEACVSNLGKFFLSKDIRFQNTPFGHAIDMILAKLGRLASSPADVVQKDNLLDLCAYAAIAYEIAAKAGKVDA